VFNEVDAIPPHEYGLVLGTSPRFPGGDPNPFFVHRMDAAADLFRAGKIRFVILSGGSEPDGVDEPEAMRQELEARGLPGSALILDRAGYRTLDSIVRAQKVYAAQEIVIVSQRFHSERALFIADRRGIQAVGYAASDVSGLGGMKVNLRELLARVKAVLDLYLLDQQPAYLGETPQR
jgi:SanA protein